MYIGSHNLCVVLVPLLPVETPTDLDPHTHYSTSAAWGRPENGSNGPTLAISNYELGVVLPSFVLFPLST